MLHVSKHISIVWIRCGWHLWFFWWTVVLFTKTKGDQSHLSLNTDVVKTGRLPFCTDYDADKMYKELGTGERKVLNKVVCHVLRSWDPTVALLGWLAGWWWHNQWKCEKMLQISDHLEFIHRVMSPVRIIFSKWYFSKTNRENVTDIWPPGVHPPCDVTSENNF